MPSQNSLDVLAAIVFPGLASLHLLGCLLAILNIHFFRRFADAYLILLPVYLIFMCAAFTALSLGFGPESIMVNLTVARNWSRIFFTGAFVFGLTVTIFYLAAELRSTRH